MKRDWGSGMRSIRKSPNERGGRNSRMPGEEERSRGN